MGISSRTPWATEGPRLVTLKPKVAMPPGSTEAATADASTDRSAVGLVASLTTPALLPVFGSVVVLETTPVAYIVADTPALTTPEMVEVTEPPELMDPSAHVNVPAGDSTQPVEAERGASSFEGSIVMTACAPAATDGPLFVAVKLQVPVVPGTSGTGDTEPTTDRSAAGRTTMAWLATLLRALGSATGPVTCAFTVSVPSTVVRSRSRKMLVPGVPMAGLGQVKTRATAVQLPPETKSRPTGSVMVAVLLVVEGPSLPTTTAIETSVPANGEAGDTAVNPIERSADAVTVTVTLAS